MPEGIVDVIPVDLVSAAIIAVAAKGPEPDIEVVQVASGSAEPAALPPPRRPRLRAGSPSTRSTTPRASPSWWPSGRSPAAAGCRASSSGPRACSSRAEGVLGSLPLRGKQAEWSAELEEKREEIEQALGYVELYGAYAECEAVYGVDRLLALWDALVRRRPARLLLRSPGHRLGQLHPPRSTCRRSSPRPACAPRRAGAPAPTREERLRKQVLAPERQLAAFDLENTLIASNVVASYALLATRRLPARRAPPLRHADAGRGPVAPGPRPQGPQRLPARCSTAATTAPRSTRSPRTPPRCSAGSSSPSRSRPPSAGCASTAPLGHRTVLITGALDFVVEAARAALRRHRRRRDGRQPTAPTTASSPTCRPPARAGPRCSWTTPRPTASTSASPWPTPTPPPTCPCSRPSASRWRSTPRPASPPSPASGAGWSSTSRSRRARPAPSCPSAPAAPATAAWPTRSSRTVSA